MSQTILSLDDLAAFDSLAGAVQIGQGRGERRFLCPLCGDGKPKDAAHRCLSLQLENGLWRCHRCGQGGKLRETWEKGQPQKRRERAQMALKRAFELPLAMGPPVNHPNTGNWRLELRNLCSLDQTQGASYLRSRALCPDLARECGAKFSRAFMGRPAIVFPLRDQNGILQGVHARYVDGRDTPKARTLGDKKNAVFATRDALLPALPVLLVTEAPLDALSLAECGYPAIALCGTSAPEWFHRVCAFRRVLLAFDADDAGERASEKITPYLTSFGARVERLRPQGAKDWNELLQENGPEAIEELLVAF